MNSKVLALLIALSFTPLLVSAQTQPPTGAPAVNPGGPMQPAHMQMFRRFHEQAEQAQRAARSRMLAALSAQHRLLVAHIVGMLAISANPNPRAAAQAIDAALSASERAAILNVQHSAMEQMRAQMEQMRSQMQQMHPQGTTTAHSGTMRGRGHHHHHPDAGETLLRSLLPGHSEMPMMMRMHPHPMPT